MSKKHWIYIKRGLSEDAKHRAAMGECVWLFMHIIDRADWETGIAYDWKDSEEAADMSMPVDTLRRQRQKLEEADYIRCEQKQHAQNIRIMEWRNPRDYGCEVKNTRSEGSHTIPPSNFQGDNQGLNQGQAQVRTPTFTSKSRGSKCKEGASAKPPAPPEVKLFREVTRRFPNSANFEEVVESVSKVRERLGRDVLADDLKKFYSAWTSKGYNPLNLAWLEWAETGQIPVNGTWKSQKYGESKTAARAQSVLNSLKTLSEGYAANGE